MVVHEIGQDVLGTADDDDTPLQENLILLHPPQFHTSCIKQGLVYVEESRERNYA
jgi:hypothetical protein